VNEAPPDHNNTANDEFDQDTPFNSHYYINSDNWSNFSKEINDGEFTKIYIHYNLSEKEADMDLILFLDTIYATHEKENVPSYNMKIKVKPPNGELIEIGEYEFGSGDNISEEQSITIDTDYTTTGENIILLENANLPYSGHWLFWDSLKLEATTHPRPDLVPTSLSFNPTKPTQGDTVRVTANIRNDGQIDAMNVRIDFYYNDNGELILFASNKVPSIPVSSSDKIYVDWDTSNIKGDHLVTLVVDPEYNMKELDEENNNLTGIITIKPDKCDTILCTIYDLFKEFKMAIATIIAALIGAGWLMRIAERKK
jgi:hypothetical protein